VKYKSVTEGPNAIRPAPSHPDSELTLEKKAMRRMPILHTAAKALVRLLGVITTEYSSAPAGAVLFRTSRRNVPNDTDARRVN
jgi:hypothetical protein